MQKSTSVTQTKPKLGNLKIEKTAKPAKPTYTRSKSVFYGEVLDSYPQYNLVAERIIRDGVAANTQLIIKDDHVVHTFTEKYKVLPNEEALKVADTVRKEAGLVWAKDMKKDWKGPLTIPQYLGKMNGAITSLLIDPKEVNLSAGTKFDDDWIRFGIGIGNSINGTSSLKAYGFTFRQICANFAFHFFHLGALKVEAEVDTGKFNDAKVLNKQVFIHSKNINIEMFEESVKEVLKAGKLIVKRYQAMRVEELLEKQALEIARRMPKTVLKKASHPIDWLKWDKKKGAQFVKGVKVNKYDAFNDVTDALTHYEDISYRVRMNGFKRLDKILVAPAAK